jgi:hypothetical protein
MAYTKEEIAMANLLLKIAIYWDAVGPEIAEVERNGMKLGGQELHMEIAPLICRVLQSPHCHMCVDPSCGDNQSPKDLLEKFGKPNVRWLNDDLHVKVEQEVVLKGGKEVKLPVGLKAEVKREILKRGSDHYKAGDIEPIDYMFANGLGEPFCLGCIIKYATRCNLSGTKKKDLMKIIHYTEFLLENLDKEEGKG